MDWLFERREKSLAHSAQRVVADMHKHLEEEKKKSKNLEKLVLRFQSLCTDSLENELLRLETRRSDLMSELESVEQQLKERRAMLEITKEDVRKIIALSASHDEGDGSLPDNRLKHFPNSSNPNAAYTSESILHVNKDVSKEKSHSLEEQYVEEEEVLESCRDAVDKFLFLLHKNDSEDLISYSLGSLHTLEGGGSSLIDCCKVVDISSLPRTVQLSVIDLSSMNYNPKILPNHDRDFPDVKDISLPYSLKNPKDAKKVPPAKQKIIFGQLVGAFEIPLISEVIIDVWRAEEINKIWATTTIDNVNFAVLERIFVTSEVSWGVSNIVQIDIFGRHPKNGYLIVESIVASTE